MHVYGIKSVIGGLERTGDRLKKHRVCEGPVRFLLIEIYGGPNTTSDVVFGAGVRTNLKERDYLDHEPEWLRSQ